MCQGVARRAGAALKAFLRRNRFLILITITSISWTWSLVLWMDAKEMRKEAGTAWYECGAVLEGLEAENKKVREDAGDCYIRLGAALKDCTESICPTSGWEPPEGWEESWEALEAEAQGL